MENRKLNDRKKFLLFLPLLIIPFLALVFYAFGGGKSKLGIKSQSGINSELPDARFPKQKPIDKFGIYELQTQDSTKRVPPFNQIPANINIDSKLNNDPTSKIELKLKELNQQINGPEELKTVPKPSGSTIVVPGMKSDVDRLEKLMSSMQNTDGPDQEVEQLNSMLEKIIDIQHPQRIQTDKINAIEDNPDKLFLAIPAKVASTKTVLQGAVLKLVLDDSITIHKIFLPKGQEIFGLCNLKNQRLLVDIKTIRIGNKIIPVNLSIYGMDGIKGISAPDAVVKDALAEGSDNALRNLQVLSPDQTLGIQMAGAGLEAAKGLFSKKVRGLKMKIKAGLPVLLRDNDN